MNPHLLQIELTPAEYRKVDPGPDGPDIASPHTPDYWRSMPTYLLARCPLCGGTYTAKLDTYSLQYWLYPFYGEHVYGKDHQKIDCSHFVCVHHFINLNGVAPREVPYTELYSEVPCVMSFFLPDDVESYAVMHALPICRVEQGRFVPRYSLYAMTYFSTDPRLLRGRRWQAVVQPESHHPPFVRTPNFRDRDGDTWWDLPRWVRAGKLLWLDAGDPALPLRVGPVEAFPYVNITGRREQRSYRDGKMVVTLYERRMRRKQ